MQTGANASPGAATKRSQLNTMRDRRIKNIILVLESPTEDKNISSWLSSLDSNGKWPDKEVDYTTGCAAQRANWPAQVHWRRILTMSAAWHGGLKGTEQFAQKPEVKAAILRAIGYWLRRDFTNKACLDKGGTTACPCSNPDNTLWNTNWFSNVIRIPQLVGQAALLLGADNLSGAKLLDRTTFMLSRGYTYPGLTGANLLDISRIGMDLALLTDNSDLLAEAYSKAHSELKIMNKVKEDGIRADGAFAQHDGMLYNGNYGKDYANDVLGIEIEAIGTPLAADATGKIAFGTQFEGNQWMVVQNTVTGVLHWDFSVLGRFISFPVSDAQATGSLNIDLNNVLELGQGWNLQTLIQFAKSLMEPTPHANAGNLAGNRNFYTNDYMVHRGKNYVSTLKTWSVRTRNTECINSQNPLGFHLADGVTYTYTNGNEYEDIAAAWDWNLIPGITTDYGNTPLTCENTKLLGLEAFVGGASDGKIGIAVMKYKNPVTSALEWQKAWFYMENGVQHVTVSNLVSESGKPVYSVLDQKRRQGSVECVGAKTGMTMLLPALATKISETLKTLWHGGVGYSLGNEGEGLKVTVQVGQKKGDWSKIGTSTAPPVMVDMFTAWIEHEEESAGYPAIEYSVFPGTTQPEFVEKATSARQWLKTLSNDGDVSAVFDRQEDVLMAVFWDKHGGNVEYKADDRAPVALSVDGNAAVIYRLRIGQVSVADPGQSLSKLTVTVTVGEGQWPEELGNRDPRTLVFQLPAGGKAGSSVTQTL